MVFIFQTNVNKLSISVYSVTMELPHNFNNPQVEWGGQKKCQPNWQDQLFEVPICDPSNCSNHAAPNQTTPFPRIAFGNGGGTCNGMTSCVFDLDDLTWTRYWQWTRINIYVQHISSNPHYSAPASNNRSTCSMSPAKLAKCNRVPLQGLVASTKISPAMNVRMVDRPIVPPERVWATVLPGRKGRMIWRSTNLLSTLLTEPNQWSPKISTKYWWEIYCNYYISISWCNSFS